MTEQTDKAARFEAAIMPHLDAAHNLARWLVGDDRDAEDVAQEAALRAFKFFDGFRGGSPRAWLLAITRRSALNWISQNRRRADEAPLEEDAGAEPAELERVLDFSSLDAALVRKGIEALPPGFREIIVLREFEDLPYDEIATVLGIPPGTVMSRLSRARRRLRAWWTENAKESSL